jgi:hypothetical protein
MKEKYGPHLYKTPDDKEDPRLERNMPTSTAN